MVMELFPRKKYADEIREKYRISSRERIYVGDAPVDEDMSVKSTYRAATALLRQYSLDGKILINELDIIETGKALKGYEKILEYDLFDRRIRIELLSSVMISCGNDSYAYIYSGSCNSKVAVYSFEADDLKITRIAFDNRYITLEDLNGVIDRVLSGSGCGLLLRSSAESDNKVMLGIL